MATRNIVPRADSEGQIGTSAKSWLTGFFDTVNVLGASVLKHITTPANPASGYNKLYFKSDDKLYSLTSAGSEMEIGVSGANTALSNLASVAINDHLLPGSDDAIDLGDGTHEFRDLRIDGKAYIDGLGENMLVDLDTQIQFGDSAVHIQSDDDGHLDLTADTSIDFIVGSEIAQINSSGLGIGTGVNTDELLHVENASADSTPAIKLENDAKAWKLVIDGADSDKLKLQETTDANANIFEIAEGTQVLTFTQFPVTPSSAPTTDYQVANKKYVDDNAGGATLTRATFVNGDLTAGKLTVTHSQGLSAPYTVMVVIFDNNGKVILPDEITGSTNSFEIDISSFGTISGTWGYGYIA